MNDSISHDEKQKIIDKFEAELKFLRPAKVEIVRLAEDVTNLRHLLSALVDSIDHAEISFWQSTSAWKSQLDAAREYLNKY